MESNNPPPEEPLAPDPQRPVDYNTGWKVVTAAFLLPIGWIVTGSIYLTMIVGTFGIFTMMRDHPQYEPLFRDDPVFRAAYPTAGVAVLLIFLATIVRNLMKVFS